LDFTPAVTPFIGVVRTESYSALESSLVDGRGVKFQRGDVDRLLNLGPRLFRMDVWVRQQPSASWAAALAM
jgi:hypothetical protein